MIWSRASKDIEEAKRVSPEADVLRIIADAILTTIEDEGGNMWPGLHEWDEGAPRFSGTLELNVLAKAVLDALKTNGVKL